MVCHLSSCKQWKLQEDVMLLWFEHGVLQKSTVIGNFITRLAVLGGGRIFRG
jgi:hypothetical protein